MLSIIIPALDEERALPRTLDHLKRLSGEYEIILVDGGSQDATRKIAEKRGIKVVKADKGITQQLTAGILASRGDMFLLLHADCLLHQESILNLNDLENSDKPLAGAFVYQYDRFHPLLTLQSSWTNLNARILQKFDGEQAIFLNKQAMEKIKNFPQTNVFEGKALSKQLKQANVKTILLEGPVTTSSRRFKYGVLKHFLKLNYAHLLNNIGAPEYKVKRHLPRIR